MQVLENDLDLMSNLADGPQGFKRSLYPRKALRDNPLLAEVLQHVLIYGFSEDEPKSNEALNECYRRGWLHAELLANERIVYVHPTRVHHRYAEILLRTDVPKFPLDQYPTVRDLSFAAIRQFSMHSLRSSGERLGPAAESRPLEAQYQDEFYRACYVALGRTVYLTPEWTGKASSGRVDFQIKSVGWAIECVRDGDGLNEHIARFQPNGKYHSWIFCGQVKKGYILLDFRKTMPTQARGANNSSHLYLYFPAANQTSWCVFFILHCVLRGLCRLRNFRFNAHANRNAHCVDEVGTGGIGTEKHQRDRL